MSAVARRDFWNRFKPKLIGLSFANILFWVACNTFYKMPLTFPILFSAFTLIFLLFFVVSDLKLTAGETFVDRFIRFFIYYAFISGGAITAVIWAVTARMGFPPMFIVTIIIFALLCLLLFFVLEFKPEMKEPKGLSAVNNLLLLFFGMSFMYYYAAATLPQFEPANEIAKLKAAGLKLSGLDKGAVIRAGMKVFRDFECTNCHNVKSGADPKRGPVLNEVDLGDRDNILENIVDPYKVVKKPYADDRKLARAMPDYYGQQMTKDEIEAVITYMENLKTMKAIPTDKMPDGWWTDPKVIAEGKKIYVGLFNEDVACHACHGKDGTPLMEEASDFRTSERLKNTTTARLFQIVKYGYSEESLMGGWGDYLSDEQVWQVIAYVNIFPHGMKPAVRPEPEDAVAIKLIKEKYWEE
jgi:mono/diheme cytochrome c family protein